MKVQRRTMKVAEAAKILGIGVNAAYAAVHRGEIPAVRIGERYLVSRAALDELLKRGTRPAATEGPSAA